MVASRCVGASLEVAQRARVLPVARSVRPPGPAVDVRAGPGSVALRPSQVPPGGAANPAASVLGVVGRQAGQPLPAEVKADAEAAFGVDFSDVRIHTGSEAAQSAAGVAARAYTVGNEIVFGRGSFAPGTPEGRHDLAHELTHVIQQRTGSVAGTDIGAGVAVSDPSDAFEQEAEATARRFTSGHRVPAAGRRRAPSAQPAIPLRSAVVQREGGSVLPGWLVRAGETAESGVEGVGMAVSAGAIAVAAAAAAVVLTWSSPADVSPAEEQLLLSRDRAVDALRAIAKQILEVGAITVAAMTPAEIERLRGRVNGAVDVIRDVLSKDPKQRSKCAKELALFEAAALALLTTLSQPPDKIDRQQVLGLLTGFQQAMQDLLVCMGAVRPGPGPN